MKGEFHVTGAGQACDDREGWMAGEECTDQELRAEEGKAQPNREDVSFDVKVVNRSYIVGAGGK